MNPNIIELSNLSLKAGWHTVLKAVTLSIRAGEFIGALGPNGAGKTTLIRALLGLIQPSSGSIRVFGQPAARGHPAIAYVPQTGSALACQRLCGFDFVASAANGRRWGWPWMSRKQRAAVYRALEQTDAGAFARRALGELSGGERQRLLLAQCLLGEPKLLLLDEPLIGLDPPHQQHIIALIRRIQQSRHLTVLLSAHELNPLLPALDRALYLGNGAAALGAVDEVITGPVLSRLYGAAIEVLRVAGHIFVMADHTEIGKDAHRHV
ncbi:ABC transporter, ATP-binding protein [Candidatus Glomeribacter gigasporarum BEG34]|uniref:ABC transporter, ATP-binding protein n=1 Tax=Candidatus Glomeribacter gigasporarum BEG34 TaxID=1070319 RepID=G2J7Z0_9BURK|nr:ABC transporter ATP-binding protein [Candidatus Glomeribacter gigasporarum]CCD28887.1 ABC transporter, ATP-binding protein [Candidatus Glomeribacter gigasporarum BEG34]